MAMSECIRDRRSVNKNGLQNTSAPFGAIFHLLLVLVSLSFRPKKKMLQTLRHDQGDSRSSRFPEPSNANQASCVHVLRRLEGGVA